MTVLTRPHVPSLAYRGSDDRRPQMRVPKLQLQAHHRGSIDEWNRIVTGDLSQVRTQIQHSPIDAWAAARRRSIDSSDDSKKMITRVDSFSLAYEEAQRRESVQEEASPSEVWKDEMPVWGEVATDQKAESAV